MKKHPTSKQKTTPQKIKQTNSPTWCMKLKIENKLKSKARKGAWISGEKLKQQKIVGGKNILIKSINKSFKWSQKVPNNEF